MNRPLCFFSGCNPQVLTEYILLHFVSLCVCVRVCVCVCCTCGHVCGFSGGCFVLLLANTEESVVRSARCEIALSSASPVREGGGKVTQILWNILPLCFSVTLYSLFLSSSGDLYLGFAQQRSPYHPPPPPPPFPSLSA